MSTNVTPQEVVDRMLQLREQRSQLKKEYEERDKQLRTMMERGENWLLQHMHETGHKSFKVEGATVYTSATNRYSFGDWSGFAEWVRKTGEVDLLQHRVSSRNLDEYVKEHGELPPGVKKDPVVSVNIRKS